MTLTAKPKPLPMVSPSFFNTSPSLKTLGKTVSGILLTLSAHAAYAEAVPMPTYNEANSDLVNQGAYVARAADCMGCHKEDFSGGVKLATPMGDVYATNITPSIRYGIGNYTEEDLKNALRHGKTPNHMLYPAMPYPAYSGMSDEDIHALFAYMQTIPAVDEEPEHKTDMKFPFNIRSLMHGWNLVNMPKWQSREGLDETQKRGEYLVNNLEHCGTCHTPRNSTMGYNMDQYLAGATLGNWHAPNITPDETSGIGSWSEEDIITYLRNGSVANKALAAGPMSEVVVHSTRYLKDSDLEAIASYLKAIPAIETDDTIQPFNTAALPQKHSDDITFDLLEQKDYLQQAKNQAGSETESLYLTNCASCHGVDGYGQADAGYASIIGLTSLRRDNPAPVINVITNGVKDVASNRPRMPGFKDDLSAEQIADITNYVRTNFGGLSNSQVTADDVNNHLNQGADVPFLIKNAGWLSLLGIIVGILILIWIVKWLFNRRHHS